MFRREHIPEVVTIWGDPISGKYLADPYYENAEELAESLGDELESEYYYFVVSLIGTEAVMGTCSIGPEKDPTIWGIGYTVRKEYWGNGYATEMIKAMLDFAYSCGIRNFVSHVAQENKASNRVMQKLNFQIDQETSFNKSGTDIVFPSYIYKLQLD